MKFSRKWMSSKRGVGVMVASAAVGLAFLAMAGVAAGKGGPPTPQTPPVQCTHTKIGVAVDPAEIPEGGTATVTATLTTGPPASTPLPGETVSIWWALVPDPPGPPSFGLLHSGTTDGSGQYSASFDASALVAGNHVQFYASFAGDSTYCGDESPKVNARIVAAAEGCAIPGVVNLTNPSATWDDTTAGHAGSGSFTIEICNGLASPITFKVQGGTDGWNNFTSATPTFGSAVKTKLKASQGGATVVAWTVTLDPNETESIVVDETGTVPRTCGSQAFLSGEWSAAYTDPVTGLPTKEAQTDGTLDDYTQRSYITVTC